MVDIAILVVILVTKAKIIMMGTLFTDHISPNQNHSIRSRLTNSCCAKDLFIKFCLLLYSPDSDTLEYSKAVGLHFMFVFF